MSCSCCCCVAPGGELLEGLRRRRRKQLLREGEEDEDEEESRVSMDISLLTEQYRCIRETQRTHTRVLLFRTVSEELSEAVSIIPVPQGLTSSREPSCNPPPVKTSDPDLMTYDPWRKCSCPAVIVPRPASCPETTGSRFSRRSLSDGVSTESFLHVRPASSSSGGKLSSTDSACSSVSSTREGEEEEEEEAGHLHTGSSGVDPDAGSSARSFLGSHMDPAQTSSVSHPVGSLCTESSACSSFTDSPVGSLTSSESSTPVASIACSTAGSIAGLQEDPRQSRSAHTRGVLPSSCTPAWRGGRKSSAPALRLSRQLSVDGVGSSVGVHQNKNYYPFPSRKTPRISEAARKLGMYSSF